MKFRPGIILTALLALTPALLGAEKITFQADSMVGNTGKKNEYTRLDGNAAVVTESMEIYADVIELSGKDFRFIKATGNVKGVNKDAKLDFTCGEMYFDRETKLATLQNAVHLDDKENDVSADAELIEYNQGTEIAIMQISVTLKQKENTCTAAYAIYRKKDGLLSMSGNPRVQQGKDTFRAQEIDLNLETQEITLDGRVRGSVTTDGSSGGGSSTSSGTGAPSSAAPGASSSSTMTLDKASAAAGNAGTATPGTVSAPTSAAVESTTATQGAQ